MESVINGAKGQGLGLLRINGDECLDDVTAFLFSVQQRNL